MFFWNSLAFSMIQWMLAIWSLVPLPFLNPWELDGELPISGWCKWPHSWTRQSVISLQWSVLFWNWGWNTRCVLRQAAFESISVFAVRRGVFLRHHRVASDAVASFGLWFPFIIHIVRFGRQDTAFLSVPVCSAVSDSLWTQDCSPPGSSVLGVSQARTLEWVAVSSSRASSQTRDQTRVSPISRRILYPRATWEACIGFLQLL